MKRALITGGNSGLGAEILKQLTRSREFSIVYDWSLPHVDITSSLSIEAMIEKLELQDKELDVLINNAGTNEIAYLPDLKESEWDRVMNTNAKGMMLVTQSLLDRLRGGTVLNIVSNASRVPMTASAAYNASKGAAAILSMQMARELKKTHDITVFSISPGKLAGTGMSQYIEGRVLETRGWSPEYARQYQLDGLKAGEEINIETLAEFIVFLLSTKERHKYLHGQDIPYGG